jgi:oxalate decarboxylase
MSQQTIGHPGAGPDDSVPQPIRGGDGASVLGPRNVPLERENPSLLNSLRTDSGTVPNLKFSFATARNRVLTGGCAREVTPRELPVAAEIAGVNMCLKAGGIRELHWHREAEWAYMLAGRARITAIDSRFVRWSSLAAVVGEAHRSATAGREWPMSLMNGRL